MRGRTSWASVAIAGALICAGAAEAKTFEVTRANDPNPGKCKPRDCSLREAVSAANGRPGKDTIVLPGKRYELNRGNPGGVSEDANLSGDLDVNNDPLVLTHPGKGKARIDNDVDDDRVLHIQEGAATTLQKIVVTGGDNLNEDGGGILTEANLKLSKSVVTQNRADDGAGIDLDVDARLAMTRSAVTRNLAEDLGGGINTGGGGAVVLRSRITGNRSGSEGAGLDLVGDAGAVRVTRSQILGNRTQGDGGGADLDGDDVVVKQTTIAGNRAVGEGGGIVIFEGNVRISSSTISGNRAAGGGGGVRVALGSLTATNSTIAGNRANDNGGGIHADESSIVALNAVTVARNNSGADDPGPAPTTGGGLYMIDSTFELQNTLLGLNTVGIGGIQRNDCEGETFTSLGNNLVSDDTECDGFTAIGDITNVSPKLEKLAKNGGPTKTAALRKGSPAIGEADRPSAPNRDQRGRKRDTKPDIGAFERGA